MSSSRPAKLSSADVDRFTTTHQGWRQEADGLEKTFAFPSYGEAVAFAVRLAFAADKRDHHPDLNITWGKVAVRWSTHDAGGITALDVEMAAASDQAFGR